MLIVSPDCGTSRPDSMLACLLGDPWSVRLAGAGSACPALELYEAGEILDVISATNVVRPLLRGARATASAAGPRAIAWGRLPASGIRPLVSFGPRRRREDPLAATVFQPAAWCWVAVGDGRFDSVTVQAGEHSRRRRLARGRPCC
jgi:hypothetical protein